MTSLDAEVPLQTIGKRYLLQELIGQGGMGTVYRAHDRLTGQDVALKHVTLESENIQFASRASSLDSDVALAREFKTLASLRHPNIISVLDYGFSNDLQPYYTMELLESAQNILEVGQSLHEEDQVQLLIQVLQALSYLHRRDIIHRDLKPDNVLVVDGQVKVLDFGLAVAQDHLQASSERIAGTLAYMAPEVLQGQPATVASDMYAVGVIAYELFGERHPFDLTNITQLINDIVFTAPKIESLGLDTLTENIMRRLLAKNPVDRYRDARELIHIYAESTNQQHKYETDVIRESYLQAARFVGRDAEIGTLNTALEQAQSGMGSTWLISGESGVGKSRLLEEVRTLALVQGVFTIQGGAGSNGGSPYQIWRDPLRRLVLETEPDDSIASVLKTAVPDISNLLGRSIPDAPALDPQAAQNRLADTIEVLLRCQERPLAILLEDLHWAGSESLALLDRISQLTGLNVLVVATYRDDEIIHLIGNLQHTDTLKLERLNNENIRKLSESILGENGRSPEVVELLQRETEGNVFFIVEVIRALAEEAGQLNLVGAVSLPNSIFAGGIQRIVARRLQQVPEAILNLLQYAAIIGRQIDLRLLHELNSDFDEEAWLTACSDAAVLDVLDDRWRFVHDKLRENLLAEMSVEQREQLHKEVAQAIETVYADDLAPYYERLAHHWSEAQVTFKAIDYLEKSGQQALENYANEEALQAFKRALDLSETIVIPERRRALWHRQIGQSYWGLGNLAALREHVETALRLHDRPIPSDGSQLGLSLLRQVGIQSWHRLRPANISNRDREHLLEIIRAYKLLGQAYFFLNESNLTIYVTLQQLNLAERIPPSSELAEAYANMCIVAALVPLHSLANTYQKRGLEIADLLQDPYTQGQVTAVCSLYHLGIGHWDTVQEFVERSTHIAKTIGDHRIWESVSGVGALAHGFAGRFERALDIFGEVYASSRRSNNLQTYIWGTLGQAENLLILGNLEKAYQFIEEAQSLPIEDFGRDSVIRANVLLALAQHRQGNVDVALTAANKALQLITSAPPTASYLLHHYGVLAMFFLAMSESNPQETPYQQSAQAMCKALQGFARVFPIGRPRAALGKGQLLHLNGKSEQAENVWKQALPIAHNLAMPYDTALLHLALGIYANPSERKWNLTSALDIFTQLQASHDVTRTQNALQQV